MTMTMEEIQEQGRLHYQSIQAAVPVTPPSHLYPKMDEEDAYAIAGEVVRRYLEDGYTVAGKKIGLTSSAMRRLGGIYEPDYGVIFNECCYTNEGEVPAAGFVQPAVEAELGFRLKADLTGREITPEDVLRATEYVVPCLELVDVRQRLDVPRKVFDSIADNASFGAFVVGDTPVRPYEIDFGLVGYVYEHNNRQAEVSCGAAVLDHPVKAVAWLANRFREIGQPLRAGEFILSGSAIAMETAAAGDNFRCRYGRLGEVSVNFV